MDLTLPLYRQLFGRFLSLIVVFLLVIITSVGLYLYQSQQLLSLNTQYLPEFKQHNSRQALLVSHERLMNTVIGSQTAVEYRKSYKTLTDNLKQLAGLSRKNRQLLGQLSQRMQLQVENVIRLNDSARRNIQLKDSVVIQLTLVADSLSELIANQYQQQNDLYLQINSDRLTDRVTAVRAVALSKVATSLNRNRELHRLLVDCLVMFTSLDLQYDLIEFDYLQQRASTGFQKWITQVEQSSDISSAEATLKEQVIVLNNLLFIEQNTFAKWRGQLSRALDYRTELLLQKAELSPFLAKVLDVNLPETTPLNKQLASWFSEVGIEVSEQDYIWLIAAIYILFTLVFITLLVRLRTRLKRFKDASKTIIAEYIQTGASAHEAECEEIQQAIAGIKQIRKPKYSEADYLNLLKEQQFLNAFMSQHSEHLFWQLPDISPVSQKTLLPLFGTEKTVSHWRHLFSRNDVSAILTSAREAKRSQNVQRLLLVTHQESEITLSIEFINNSWRGSVCSAQKLQQLNSENQRLQQQLSQQSQNEKLNIINSSEHVSRAIAQTILNQQLDALALQKSDNGHAQILSQLRSWSQQQKVSAQLRRDDYLLSLSDVNIIDELYIATANVQLQAPSNHNVIYVSADDNVNPDVTIESALFQSLIREVSSILLAKQHQASLDVSLQVIDVNSAQQTICFNFLLSNASCKKTLTEALECLNFTTEATSANCSVEVEYLRDLMLVFNASNSENVVIDDSGKFAFEMALVNAEHVDSKKVSERYQPPVFAKANVLVVATDVRSRQRICNILNNTKLTVDTMRDLTLFQRQLSIKHLTENTVDVLIISAEVYHSDYKLIAQHIASLPEKLQPKLLISQQLIEQELASTGVYSTCFAPWYQVDLLHQLSLLLTDKRKNNLLIASEVFGQQRFLVNQVELLFAVAKPDEHQLLLRLLHWLGFRITLVSSAQQLEEHWQTSQYLLLVSELLTAELSMNANVKFPRGIFCIDEQQSIENYFNSQAIAEEWQATVMPPALDIQAIIQLFTPWLRPVLSHKHGLTNALNNSNAEAEISLGLAKENFKEQAVCAESDEIALEDSVENAYFDLTQYAQNQGSAELAAIMLDDYLFDIEQLLLEFSDLIEQNNSRLALLRLNSLIQLSKVIASEPLLQLCHETKESLSQANDELSKQDTALMQQQVVQLNHCFSQLVGFAESI